MNGLRQIGSAVLKTLTDAGICAVAAYDGSARQYATEAVVAVEAAQTSGRPMAMGGYLGESYDQESGTVRELYGRQMKVELCLDVRAATAAECQSGGEAVSDALESGGLPAGLRMGEECWEAITWDGKNHLFLRRGKIRCTAYFTASAQAGGEMVLDFILKGVMKT